MSNLKFPIDSEENEEESIVEFERLESTLPPALQRSASSLLEAIETEALANATAEDSHHESNKYTHLQSPQPQHVKDIYQDISGRPPQATPNLRNANLRQHLISKLSQLENGRDHSPIPLPKPRFNENTYKPALNTKQSSTGVLWATERASEYGYDSEHVGDWANLGQGAPEHGDSIPGSFPRPKQINLPVDYREYAPTAGIKQLREAVANYYNATYRQGKPSQYTYKNVCIVPGGRAGLTRIASIISDVYLSFSFQIILLILNLLPQ